MNTIKTVNKTIAKAITIFLSLLLILAPMSALLGGCTGDDAGSGGESAQSQASASSSVSASAAASAAAVSASNYSPPAAITYPADVTDGLGVSMTIKSKPSAIISLSLGTDEMLLAIADHSSVKAVSGAISEDAKISNIAEEAKNFPKAASNSENIISLKPDLVIANDWTSSELVNQLRDAGITVYSYITPTDIDGQIKVISDLASVIGEAVKGGAVIDEMNRVLESTSEKLKALKEEDKATVLSYNLYGSTNGKGTSFDDIVTRAGLINAAAAADLDPYAQISKEKIIEMNPDILFLPDITYEINTDPETFAESIRNDPSLAAVNAVKNGRIYLLPDKHMTSTSQYMAYGVEDAAKAAYPELFK